MNRVLLCVAFCFLSSIYVHSEEPLNAKKAFEETMQVAKGYNLKWTNRTAESEMMHVRFGKEIRKVSVRYFGESQGVDSLGRKQWCYHYRVSMPKEWLKKEKKEERLDFGIRMGAGLVKKHRKNPPEGGVLYHSAVIDNGLYVNLLFRSPRPRQKID